MEHAIIRHLPLVLATPLGAGARSAGGAEPQLAHMGFITLKDRCPEARQKLVITCHEHLTGHEGTVSFSVGTIAEDVVEPVSDRDFDVALHLFFENNAAIAADQKSATRNSSRRTRRRGPGSGSSTRTWPRRRDEPAPWAPREPGRGAPCGESSPSWSVAIRNGIL